MTVKPAQKNDLWYYFFIGIVLISLHFFLTFHEGKIAYNHYSFLNRSWGFNHIKFYDVPVTVIFYSILLALAIPFINQKIYLWIEKAIWAVKFPKKIKYPLFIVMGIVAFFYFYTVRNAYFLLGDYTLRISQTMKQDFIMTEYFTMKLLYYICTFFSRFNISPNQCFVTISCVAGGIFVTVYCFIANLLGENRFQKVMLFIGGIMSGMLLMFCGYIDIYALPIVFTAVYIYMSLLYINNKKYFLPALISLAIAIAGHFLCVAFAPALFIAWYHHNKNKLPFITKMSSVKRLMAILVCTLIAIMMVYNLKTGFILPLYTPAKNLKYLTLFSFTHIWEYINGQLLGCGVSLIIISVSLYKIIREKLSLSIQIYFFITGSAGMLLVAFLSNLHRGSGDWDISSLPAITLNTLAVLLLLRLKSIHQKLASYLLIILIGYNTLNACLWIHINSGHKSLEKVENMLITDPGTYYTSKLPGIVQLIYIYKENKLMKEAERLAHKACDFLPVGDIRGCTMYADLLILNHKDAQAVEFYENYLKKNQNVPQAYAYLIFKYQEKNQNEKVLPLIFRLYQAFKTNPNLFLLYMQPQQYIDMFEYLQGYLRATNPNADLKEINGVIAKLKQIKAKQPITK
ncbi:MAG: hypothetical protein V4506_14805 [Bacteroidota bacterium]